MAWLRLDEHIPENKKAQKLAPELFKFWINVLCVAKAHDGVVELDDAEFRLRPMLKIRIVTNLEKLVAAELVDFRDGTYSMHDWDKWQYKSDVSTNRVKRFRNRSKKQMETATVNVSALYSVDSVVCSEQVKPEQQQTADEAPSESLKIPSELVQSEYPKTLSEIRKVDPGVDETFVRSLANCVAHKILSHPTFPEHRREIATTDQWIAKACRESFATGPPNHRAGLLLKRVPNILVSWGMEKQE